MKRMTRRRRVRIRRRCLTPLQQGDLDGLCGVYSIVNAVRWLIPKLSNARAKKLFAQLMQGVRRFDHAPGAIAHAGIERQQLLGLLDIARRFMRHDADAGLVVGRVPPVDRRSWSTATLWRVLDTRLSARCVAIIGITGRHDHWTLAIAVSASQIRLFDCDGMQVLRRSQFARDRPMKSRVVIEPGDVIFISTGGPQD